MLRQDCSLIDVSVYERQMDPVNKGTKIILFRCGDNGRLETSPGLNRGEVPGQYDEYKKWGHVYNLLEPHGVNICVYNIKRSND